MRCRRKCAGVASVLAAMLLMPLATAAQNRRQEPLTLDGILGTSFSMQSDGVNEQVGKQVAVSATLAGYWKHPAILSYSLSPRIGVGRQVVSVDGEGMGGGKGIGGMVSFLSGSQFPLNISYLRNWSNTSALDSNDPVAHINELSSAQQSLNVNWSATLRRLPTFNVSYTKVMDASDIFTGQGTGKETQDMRNLQVTAEKSIGSLNFRSGFNDQNNAVNPAGDLFGEDNANSRNYFATAGSPLPFKMDWSVDFRHETGEWTSADTSGSSTGDSVYANLGFHPWSRLTARASTTYTTNVNGTLTKSVIGGQTNLLTSSADASHWRIGTGLTYNIGWGISSFADLDMDESTVGTRLAGGNVITDGTITATLPSTQWRAGAIWGRRLLGGNASLSYTHIDTEYVADNAELAHAVIPNSDRSITLHTQGETVSGNYSHKIPLEINLTLGGSWLQSLSEDSLGATTNSKSWNIAGSRPVSRWNVSGSWSFNQSDSSFLQINTHVLSNIATVGLTSRRLSFNMSRSMSSNTGLRFGNSVIGINDAVTASLLPALVSSDTAANSFSVSYQPRSSIRLTGRWINSSRSLPGFSDVNQSAYDVRGSYTYRLMRFSIGYLRQMDHAGAFGRNDSRFYFTAMRRFRLF